MLCHLLFLVFFRIYKWAFCFLLILGLACVRGTNLYDDTGFVDNRYLSNKETLILRPMREFSEEEINLYNEFSLTEHKDSIQKLKHEQDKDIQDSEDSLYSIQTLTRNFLGGLQENFPATIPTIFRTGDKLSTCEDITLDNNEIDRCIICNGKKDAFGSTLEATNFSKLVSRKGKDEFEKNIHLTVDSIKNMDIHNMERYDGMYCKITLSLKKVLEPLF